MAGTFTIGEKKIRPGSYFRRENSGGPDVAGAINGYAAAAFQADWGPLNELFDMDVSMQNDVADYYGTDPHTRIIREAFTGGATTVRAIRCGDDDGKAASVTLKAINPTNSAKVDAVTITAAYPGTREFAVSIRTNLITDQRECVIYDGTVIFEKFAFEAGNTEAENLIAAMASSKNFVAKAVGTVAPAGPLETVTQVPMTGGKNPTVTTASYDRAFNQLERVKWNCLIVDTDEAAVQLLVQSFIQQSYEMGHFGIGCLSGLPTQDFDERYLSSIRFICLAMNEEYIFATSVEPDSTLPTWRYRFTRKLGAGVKNRYSYILVVDKNGTIIREYKEKKDAWPIWLFQFGNFMFPYNTSDRLYATTQALQCGHGITIKVGD